MQLKVTMSKKLKKIAIIIFVTGICWIAFLVYTLKTIRLERHHRTNSATKTIFGVNQAYFIDTSGCRMPYFPVVNDEIKKFMVKPEIDFKCRKPLTRTSDTGATILFNMNKDEVKLYYNITDFDKVKCFYGEIVRESDEDSTYTQIFEFEFELNNSVTVKPGIEFIAVVCRDGQNEKFYEDYHFFVGNKFPNRQNQNDTNSPIEHADISENSSNTSDDRLSVMVFGIDSVSHLNFLRQMRNTSNFLLRNLTHIEFWGYNKVGDNTYPNLAPVLTGLNENEIDKTYLKPANYSNFDACPFIWKRFKKAGYQTAFAEDVAAIGTFNYWQPGFEKQPTDYYLRTIVVEMEKYIKEQKATNVHLCMGGRRTADVVMEFIRKLAPFLKTQDFFSLFWTCTLTHEYFNMAQLLDETLVSMLQLFEETGIFNKTIVFFMSDHGMRWGRFRETYQGIMEERQPLLVAIYPKWFQRKYPIAVENMQLNARRLTAPFDIHATMLDLLDMSTIEDKTIELRTKKIMNTTHMARGISLFLPIPETRTCEMAGIASHWCLCYRREKINTDDERAQRAAHYVVQFINNQLKDHMQCSHLHLFSISQAFIATSNHNVLQNFTKDYSRDITVRLLTRPGRGLFESTVRMSNNSIEVTGTISRLNLYGNQSFCIYNRVLKLFCYCKVENN